MAHWSKALLTLLEKRAVRRNVDDGSSLVCDPSTPTNLEQSPRSKRMCTSPALPLPRTLPIAGCNISVNVCAAATLARLHFAVSRSTPL